MDTMPPQYPRVRRNFVPLIALACFPVYLMLVVVTVSGHRSATPDQAASEVSPSLDPVSDPSRDLPSSEVPAHAESREATAPGVEQKPLPDGDSFARTVPRRGAADRAAAPASAEETQADPDTPAGDRICLSLRVLQSQAEAALSNRSKLSPDVANLAGITWLQGAIADPEGGDIVLVGLRCPDRPALRLDDLAVNLRNVENREAAPCCSLDPENENVLRVKRLFSGGALDSVEQADALLEQLRKAVGPQKVMLCGVPWNSRYAHVMIDADYHMKKVSQGHVELLGVPSSPARVLKEADEAFDAGRPLPQSGIAMSRFWFHVGEDSPVYSEIDGAVWIAACPVVLLTAKQKATADGELHDDVAEDPRAQAFAADMTRQLRKVENQVPEYADLENLYRLHALMRAMGFRKFPSKSGIHTDYLRSRYPFQVEKRMEPSRDGLANMKKWSRHVETGNLIQDFYLFPIVCGGVSMEMPPVERGLHPDPTDRLKQMRAKALADRPNKDALWWPWS